MRDPITALRSGELVMMVDEDAAVGGAELWLAAETAEAGPFARLVRHTSGFVTVALPAVRAATLGLPPVVGSEKSFADRRPVPAVACDAAEGISTGISAADRSLTARLLAHPASTPDDFRRPGHLVPLRVRDGLTYADCAPFAALELCRVAELVPAMVRCEVVLDAGALASPADGRALARTLGVALVTRSEVTQAAAEIALSA